MEEDNWPGVEEAQQAGMDEQADQADLDEETKEVAEDGGYGYYPTEKAKDSIFTFFRHILGIRDSSKVGNLSERELGLLGLSVRNCKYLSLVGKSLNNNSFKDFFESQSQIILETSASKKGWLVELVVSQKKFAQRTIKALRPAMIKKGLFGTKKQNEQQ